MTLKIAAAIKEPRFAAGQRREWMGERKGQEEDIETVEFACIYMYVEERYRAMTNRPAERMGCANGVRKNANSDKRRGTRRETLSLSLSFPLSFSLSLSRKLTVVGNYESQVRS